MHIVSPLIPYKNLPNKNKPWFCISGYTATIHKAVPIKLIIPQHNSNVFGP